MSTLQSILGYINEDYAPPTIRLILVSQSGILLNRIVPKKSTLKDILEQEGLKEEKNYILFGKPVNLETKIIDLIPKNYTNLSNIELIIEDKNISLENNKIYYEKILKPFDNPFKVLIFSPNEFNVSIKSYPNETIEKNKLNKFELRLSSYCNTPQNLYLSGGSGDDYSSLFSGNKHFWKINSIKTNIEKLIDLPIDKQNHSMIYIPKRYIYFIGGNNRSTFFYDIFFSTFTSWANMNKQVKNPFLVLVNDIFIYSFGEQDINNSGNNLVFERTNLKSLNPKWELKILKNQNFPLRNFAGTCIGDEIYFLGGRTNRGEKMYKFNATSENIEKCKQENTKLIPLDKNIYDLNEFNSAMIPEFQINESIQIIIFNKIRKKYRKVLYEKNFEEIINNGKLKYVNLDNSLIKENEQMKIVWKEYKNNYVDINTLPENMLILPTLEELKEGKIKYKNNINEIPNNNNIYNNSSNNEEIIISNNNDNNTEVKEEYLNAKYENEIKNNLLLKNKINFDINKEAENNNILLDKNLVSSQTEKQSLTNKDINEDIYIKTNQPEKKNNIIMQDNKENSINFSEKEKEKNNLNDSPNLYRKKTIIKQDKKNTIIIQCENNENSNDKNKVNNINKKNENLKENEKENNAFTVEYNNEILVEENKGAMLSDIISSNSELNKNNQGLNSRIIINVPKTKNIEKNKIILDNNIPEEIKELKDQQEDININIKSNEFPIQENPDIRNSSLKDDESKNNNEIEIIQIEKKDESKNDLETNNKKLVGESIEGEITAKDEESKKIDKNSNIKENNIVEIQLDNKKEIKDNDTETLLRDKIIYNESEKSELNKIEDSYKSKELKEEIITGIIQGIPKSKNNKNENKLNNEKEVMIKLEKEINKNIPLTLNSIITGNVDDDIKLNKNKYNKDIFYLKDDKNDEKTNEMNKGNTQIQPSNIEIYLKNENINPIEKVIKIENESNSLNELNPEMNIKINNELNIKDKLEEMEKNPKNLKGTEINENIEIPINENYSNVKKDKLKNDSKNINNYNFKEEIIEGEIPGLNQKISLGNASLAPIEKDKNIKISLKENEAENLNNLNNNLNDSKEKDNKLNKEKESKIYESITGSIIGTSKMKNVIEYGNTKGYKKPNIKKGKDFIHNSEIIIEGTIPGTKKIPLTLKSIFEENINQQIILNNKNLLKPSEYIINEADIPSYLIKPSDLNISDEESLKITKIKIENPEIKIENIDNIKEKISNEEILSPRLKDLNRPQNFNKEIKANIQLNNANIKHPEINYEEYSKDIIIESPSENIDIHLPKNNFDLDMNIVKNSDKQPKLKEIKEIITSDQNDNINNDPIVKINCSNPDFENLNMKSPNIEANIPSIDGNINVNINDSKEKFNITNLPNDTNVQKEIIEEIKPIEVKEEKIEVDINISDQGIDKKENDKNYKNINNIDLNKAKETKIYESITGSIIGTPRMKNIVQYGSTKGYIRPNIKKGKDFIHNPEIIIEGTIPGTKKIPLTLKSLFEDKVNNKIELNKINNHPEIKLEDYQESLILNLDVNNPKIENKISLNNDINLKSGYKTVINKPNLKELKDEIIIEKEKTLINQNHKGIEIKGVIPGIKKNNSVKPEEKKLRGQINRPHMGGSINNNISNINKDKIKEIPKYNKSINLNGPIIEEKEENDNESKESKTQIKSGKENEEKIYESITGSIIGTPRMKNIVEYGSTKGYKRPNIKKGKDFIHNPEIIIEGTIKGTKKIPLTLKSLFEDKLNTNIELNNSISKKKDEYKIKNEDIELYSLNLPQSKIDINSPELKLGSSKLNEYNLKSKEEMLKDKIKSIDINLKTNEIKSNTSLKSSSKNSEINNNIKPKEISGKANTTIKIRNIDNNNLEKIEIKDTSNKNKTEIIQGIIIGTSQNKKIEKEKESLKSNNKGSFININTNIKDNKNKLENGENITGSIKSTSTTKNYVEYGSTIGYKRPNIKKGKDFTHNPEIIIEGIIEGKKTIESNKDNKNNFINQKPKVQLRRAEKVNFIEYGSTLNFIRPNIKKGKDFYHEPRIRISKKDEDDDIPSLNKI